MNEQPPLSGSFFRSFLVVAGCMVALQTGTFVCIGIVSRIAFPDVFEPDSALPNQLCLITIGINAGLSVVVGAIAYRLAPFAKFAHCGFLAVFVALFFLQASLSRQENIPDWFLIGLMICSPVFIMIGGLLSDRLSRRRDPPVATSGNPE